MKMKQKNILFVAALAAVGAMSTACMNDTDIESASLPTGKNIVMLTGTVSAKSGAATRSVDANGKTAWVEGEKIAVYYRQNGDTWGTAAATVGTPSADGTAPIIAELENPQDCNVKLVYPASLASDGEINTLKLFNNQKGTIEDISSNWDAATDEAAITVDGEKATFTKSIKLTNQVCICKFTLNVDVSQFEISDGINTYVVKPADATKTLTVAMLPATSKFTFEATVGEDVYENEKDGGSVTLEAGKRYASSPTLSKKLPVLSASSADGTLGTCKGRKAIAVTIDGAKYAIALENLFTDKATLTEDGNAYYTFDDANDLDKTGLSTEATEWHVPTQAELEGLHTLASDENWDDTRKGLVVTIGEDPNKNTLFFPATSYAKAGVEVAKDGASFQVVGCLWSTEEIDGSWSYGFNFSNHEGAAWNSVGECLKSNGYSVRPFCKLQ